LSVHKSITPILYSIKKHTCRTDKADGYIETTEYHM